MNSNSPNTALQRTASPSLSFGSLGVAARIVRTEAFSFTLLAAGLVGCVEHRPTIISHGLAATKDQRHYETSEDFRERLGKKLFDYERAKPNFNPRRLTEPDTRHSLSEVPNRVLSPTETAQLTRAGITGYSIAWEDCWWGRTYWFYFFYRNGNSFSYDVHTNAKKNAVTYD